MVLQDLQWVEREKQEIDRTMKIGQDSEHKELTKQINLNWNVIIAYISYW